MTIQIDYAGGERFALDVARRVDELFELYEAEKKLFLEVNRAIAAGPGAFVTWCEQLTIDLLGPRRYAELLMPVYEKNVRCMGCGLCAAACPTGALRLERLSEDEMPALPVDRHAWAEQRLRGRDLAVSTPADG